MDGYFWDISVGTLLDSYKRIVVGMTQPTTISVPDASKYGLFVYFPASYQSGEANDFSMTLYASLIDYSFTMAHLYIRTSWGNKGEWKQII